jgi:hypothetical protein
MRRFNDAIELNGEEFSLDWFCECLFHSFLSKNQPSFNLRLYLGLASFSKKVPIYTFLLNEAFSALVPARFQLSLSNVKSH